jgi:hypothetical protein
MLIRKVPAAGLLLLFTLLRYLTVTLSVELTNAKKYEFAFVDAKGTPKTTTSPSSAPGKLII